MTSPPRLSVTLLYVPGDRPDRVKKALASDADVVIIDLEDSVPPEAKAAARMALRDLTGDPNRAVQVRVNPLDTAWGREDLIAVRALPAHVDVRLPKVESPSAVWDVVALLAGGTHRRLHVLLESALGVERAFEIAGADPSMVSIGLGEEDLRSDLGVTDDVGLAWARGRVVVAARAAGLSPPAQSVYTTLHDDEGLAASTRAARQTGFVGRCAIHPSQLPIIRTAFRPDPAEVTRARDLLDRMRAARTAGQATYVLEDGTFVDHARVGAAERVLALAQATVDRI
ncbi:CoA ester lyase [Actinopolymorpha sp. B9G3]|uniref:HpcH/HpaI aldolase/citrate lyase family protein n=1 Tax=Actinopolymorpha sp. B9G3 TaxID=3158970 RepID=UPI0032D99F4F